MKRRSCHAKMKLIVQGRFAAVCAALLALLAMLLPFHADRVAVQMQGPATTESEQLVFTVTNSNHRSVTYAARGEYYEALTDGGWVRLQRAPQEITDDDFAYGISPRSHADFYLSPKTSFSKPMVPGRYRFVLPYWFSGDDVNDKAPVGYATQKFTLTAP